MSKGRAKSKTTKRSRIKDLSAAGKRLAKRDIGKVRGGVVPGTPATLLRIDMQIDYSSHSHLKPLNPGETLKSS